MSLPRPVLLTLESLLNSALKLDLHSQTRALGLAGNVIEVEVKGLAAPFFVAFTTDGVRVVGQHAAGAHASIRGAPLALLRIAVTKDRKSLFSGDVVIDGDAELVQRVQSLLAGVDIDWEEHLSRLVGDVASHQIGTMANLIQTRLLGAGRSVSKDVAEYVTEEQRILPSRYEVDSFLRQIDFLRADADRIEQRIERLTRLSEARSL